MVRVALIGYGLAGKAFHAPLIRTTMGLELVAVVSSRVDELARDLPDVSALATLDQALADSSIDLVVIATPDELHAPQSLVALAAGKHVVVDKPCAISLGEARAMATQATKSAKNLSVFHNRRWDADFLTLRRLINTGALGEIRQFESHFDRCRPELGERWKDRRSGGVWQDLGPHLVDQAIQLFGMPTAVLADLCIQKPGGGACDYAHVLCDHGAVRTILHMTQSAPAHDLRFAVHGTRASYVKHGGDAQERQSKAGMKPGDPDWATDPCEGVLTFAQTEGNRPVQTITNVRGDYSAFYRQLELAIATGTPNPVPMSEALQVMAVIEAGLKSAKARAWVSPSQ